MKWLGRRESNNVDDQRKSSGLGKIGLGGGLIVVVIIVIKFFLSGGDTSQLINDISNQAPQTQESSSVANEAADDEMAKFISVALADNETVWNSIFNEMGRTYEEPKLVLFRGSTTSACGDASASVGPFYCPTDKKIYVDLSFFDDLHARFGAEKGDFAAAYVLAHEVGHHVQNLFGTSSKVRALQEQSSEKQGNKLSIALELQADFFAGVWAHHNKQMLEEGDIEEALSAANAIGDDKLQKMGGGQVMPDAFTHGTSQQRMYWFKKGFETGNIKNGDTFSEIQ